jgi:c-di-GMP-related signal transduction protein
MAEKINISRKDHVPIKGVYVARQPIFDIDEKIFAYELLFRSGFNNFYDQLDGDYATSKTIINSFVLLGIDTLTGGKMAFINFTRNLIINEVATAFPRDLLGIEVLETVEPDGLIIEACRRLKNRGYMIILDDFVFKPAYQPLIEIADIIKIDFRITPPDKQKALIEYLTKKKVRLLAEKVESFEEFEGAKSTGFSLFQGYFFSRPHIIEGRDMPVYKLNYLQILREINESPDDVEFDELEHIIKRDVSLTYKLLRFINSAAFGFNMKIQSIKQALTLLGTREIKKWVSLVALSNMGEDKPEELILLTMSRAKFCEFISRRIGMKDKGPDLFLMGMFSLIDAIIDKPMAEVLADLPLAEPVKDALMGGDNKYADVLRLVISYEQGIWEEWARYIIKLGLNEKEFPEIYANSIEWAHKIFG